MKRVKVTFYMEPTDEDDSTGLTNDDFEDATYSIAAMGGDEAEFELVDEDVRTYVPGKPKK
jgi:hypothetical protein